MLMLNEGYNEEYLSSKDKTFIDGFDWALEMAVDNFFNNNFEKGLDDDSFIGHLMTTELPDSMKATVEVQFKYGDRPDEVRKLETVADYVRMKIMDYADSCRDELLVSMIDNMSDEEKADGKGLSETVD